MSSLPRIAFLCLAFFLLAGCACPSDKSPKRISPRENVIERFEVSRDSLHLLLPVEIHGRHYPFLLDTGATSSAYDISLRSFLGDPIGSCILHTPDGDLNVTTYFPPLAKVGHLNLPTMSSVLCMDLEEMREACGEEFYGCLGMDFLGERVFRIDFDRGEVTFLRFAGPDSGVRVPVTFHNSIPHVQVTIPGLLEYESFQVDTGLAGLGAGDLRAEAFDALAERGVLTLCGQAKSASISGLGSVRKGCVEEISLGSFRHKKMLFTRRSQGSFLSLNYWSRYIVTFDFLNGAVYLKKGRHFDRSD